MLYLRRRGGEQGRERMKRARSRRVLRRVGRLAEGLTPLKTLTEDRGGKPHEIIDTQ